MKRTIKLMWGDTKLFAVPIYDEKKGDRAHQTVKEALNGDIKFDYGSIKKIYPMLWHYYQCELRDLEWKRMHHVENDTVWRITEDMADIRRKRNSTIHRNDEEYNKRKSAFKRIHRALCLLVDEGFVESFTIKPDGGLDVNWFTDYEEIKRDVVLPGIGFDTEHLQSGELTNKISVADLSMATPNGAPAQGKRAVPDAELPWYRPSIGGLVTKDMDKRDNDRATSQSITEYLYDQGHDQRNEKRRKEGKPIKLGRERKCDHQWKPKLRRPLGL